jgi:hypothetical protein
MIGLINQTGYNFAERVARVRRRKKFTQRRYKIKELEIDKRIILKPILQKYSVSMWMEFIFQNTD